jgi:protein-S-isoprenylcysteine O-methyltransferase Ste14
VVSPVVVTSVSLISIVAFMVVAQLARARATTRRGATVAEAGGLARYIAYFVFVPYVVVAIRPGPEVEVPELLRVIALVLIWCGVAFALWAVVTLGRHYDLVPEVHEDHELVRAGPYGIVRHPIYTGLGLHFAAMCLATGNILLILGTLLVTYPAFYLRALSEERLLRSRFGAAYDEYARAVGMLVPLL